PTFVCGACFRLASDRTSWSMGLARTTAVGHQGPMLINPVSDPYGWLADLSGRYEFTAWSVSRAALGWAAALRVAAAARARRARGFRVRSAACRRSVARGKSPSRGGRRPDRAAGFPPATTPPAPAPDRARQRSPPRSGW